MSDSSNPSAAATAPRRRALDGRAMRRAAPLLLAALALAGCKIVDQTTFGAKPQTPPPDLLTRALQPGPAVPLVTIIFNGGQIAYAQQLRLAVLMAEGRKPDAQYDLVTVVPARGTPAEQVAAAKAGQSDAITVADEMNGLGVDPRNIHFSARTDPDVRFRELRIYVR